MRYYPHGTLKRVAINAAGAGDNTLVAAVTGKKIRVHAMFLNAGGTVNWRLEDGAGGTALSGQVVCTAGNNTVLPFCEAGWAETSVSTLLNLELSGAVTVDGILIYSEV